MEGRTHQRIKTRNNLIPYFRRVFLTLALPHVRICIHTKNRKKGISDETVKTIFQSRFGISKCRIKNERLRGIRLRIISISVARSRFRIRFHILLALCQFCFRLFCRRWRFIFYLFIFPCCRSTKPMLTLHCRPIRARGISIDFTISGSIRLHFFFSSVLVWRLWAPKRFSLFPQSPIKFTSKLANPSKSPLYTIKTSQGGQRMLDK